MSEVVVFAGGPPPPPAALAGLPAAATVIAADHGADHALAAGLVPDLVVGDLDSVSAEALAAAAAVERHPVAKDATDLALALDAALARGATRITVVGGAEGRLDHLLGELLLLAADAYGAVELDARLGTARVAVVRGERDLAGAPGELVSLFALHGPAHGVATTGLLYPLHGETLAPGSSRGVSNVFVAARARVEVQTGVVVAVSPGTAAAGTASS